MARWAIGLSVGLLLGMSAAHATPGPRTCDCETQEVVLPRLGATHVPRNTKIWAVARNYGGWGPVELRDGPGNRVTVESNDGGGELRPVMRYDVPVLDPDRAYTVEPNQHGPTTEFTTGHDVDLVAPAAPQIRSIGITITPGRDPDVMDVGELQLDAGFDPDTALVEIEIRGAGAPIKILTVPGDWHWVGKAACDWGLPLHPGDRVSIAVTAIDLAGNESAPAVQQIVVARGSSPPDPCVPRHRGGCVPPLFLIFVGLAAHPLVVLFALVVLVSWACKSAARSLALQSATAEPLSSLAAERLVRSRQVHAGLVAVLGFAGIPLLITRVDHGGVLAVTAAVFASINVLRFLVARAGLTMIERGAEVVSHAHRLLIKLGKVEAWIDVSEGRIARARRRYAVATSIVRAGEPRRSAPQREERS